MTEKNDADLCNPSKVVSTVGSRWCPLGEAPARFLRESHLALIRRPELPVMLGTTKTARHGLSGRANRAVDAAYERMRYTLSP